MLTVRWIAVLLAACVWSCTAIAQDDEGPMASGTFKALEWRGIGPALMSGRIADIAIHPDEPNTWYVAVGSGGVWKTHNAGTTWSPLFDDQPSYSIGNVTLAPSNPNIVWVGTGEDVGGRHVAYGDGIYRSMDGGQSWENRGLKDSEHISTILVHPDNADVVYVAVQGPLWSAGGERGFYRTEDGGANWEKTLGDDEYTGVTDIVMDPRNPDVLYAATWQRHRTVAAYMGGGPKSRLHKSTDGGKTWTELKKGLPTGNMGKTGLAISPQNPDVIYAAIELDRRTGGLYKSVDRGANWTKESDAIAGGTGPHYYQELFANPHHEGWIYLVSNTTQVSKDGGKSWENLNNQHKHVDDHAIAFHPTDSEFILFGSDGGLYLSLDHTETWRYIDNLPITQFYKVAVDDDAPFYNIYGGTQDNNSQGGPSRTDNIHGIRNSDWFITLFGDGHQSATEPGNPDIVYAQWQQGNLARYDRTVGEIVYIRPQTEPGQAPDRFNWDAPILVSPHQPTRLYFASQRVYKSEDRGDSWTQISGDLTRNEERIRMPIMGERQSWDAPWDMYAMSQYNSITSLAESPLVEGLIYAGTDDGLIQVTENGGESWREIEVGRLPGVPDTAFVNDIKADLFDADTAYIALDNHKYGDFKPYLLKSTNRGRSWRSIAGDLPERHLVWRVVQDHEKADLLFAGTEFGVFFTPDGGKRWIELAGGMPTISTRDLAIQRRENDLVAATFGRGFYVLDDYSMLRQVNDDSLASDAVLFKPRDAHWYIERRPLGGGEKAAQGDAFFTAPNPPFGAVLSYYLADGTKTRRAIRQSDEKAAREEGRETPFPGWDAVSAEARESEPTALLTIRNDDGEIVRRVEGPVSEGMHRVAWDLRYPATQAIGVAGDYFSPNVRGPLAGPGRYSVSLARRVDGEIEQLAGPVEFDVVRMTQGTLHEADASEVVAFWQRIDQAQRAATAIGQSMEPLEQRIERLGAAVARSRGNDGALDQQLHEIRQSYFNLEEQLEGPPDAYVVGHLTEPGLGWRLFVANIGTAFSSYGPTPTHLRQMDIAEALLDDTKAQFQRLTEQQIPALEQAIIDAGGPLVPGMPLSLLQD